MRVSLHKFGWSEESRQAELEAIQTFLEKNGASEQAEALYALLLSQIDRKSYPEDSDLYIEDSMLRYVQYGEKEHHHDGSTEPRKFVDIQCIDQQTYLEEMKRGTRKEPDNHCFSKVCLTCGEERYFIPYSPFWGEYYLYVKNLAGIPYATIFIRFAY